MTKSDMFNNLAQTARSVIDQGTNRWLAENATGLPSWARAGTSSVVAFLVAPYNVAPSVLSDPGLGSGGALFSLVVGGAKRFFDAAITDVTNR